MLHAPWLCEMTIRQPQAKVAIKWMSRTTRLRIAECVAEREILRNHG